MQSFLGLRHAPLIILILSCNVHCSEPGEVHSECGGLVFLEENTEAVIDYVVDVLDTDAMNYASCVWTILHQAQTGESSFHFRYNGEDFLDYNGPILYSRVTQRGFQGIPLHAQVKDFTITTSSQLFLTLSAFPSLIPLRFVLFISVKSLLPPGLDPQRANELREHHAGFFRNSPFGSFTHSPSIVGEMAPFTKEEVSVVIPSQDESQEGKTWISLEVRPTHVDFYYESLFVLTLLPYWLFNRSNGGVEAFGPIGFSGDVEEVEWRWNSSFPRVVYFTSEVEVGQSGGFQLTWQPSLLPPTKEDI